MDYEKAHGIVCDRSRKYLNDLRDDVIDKQKGSLTLGVVFLVIGLLSGFLISETDVLFTMDADYWVEKLLAHILIFALALLGAAFIAYLVYLPIERAIAAKLELIDRIKKEVIGRAIDESYTESK